MHVIIPCTVVMTVFVLTAALVSRHLQQLRNEAFDAATRAEKLLHAVNEQLSVGRALLADIETAGAGEEDALTAQSDS